MHDPGGRAKKAVASLLLASCSALLAITLLGLTLRLDRISLRNPLNYLRDANIFLLRAKSIVEGNWVWSNPRVGMPFGADWHDFPMNLTSDSALMWLLSRFTDSPPMIVNLEWMIAVGLAAALAAYAFSRLGFALPASVSSGVIFALLPYTYFRGTRHLHSVDYAVPLIALAAIELARGDWIPDAEPGKRTGFFRLFAYVPAYAWIGCVLAGLAYVYLAFFAFFVLTVAGVVGFLKLRNWRTLVLAAQLAGAVAGVTLLDLSPSLIYWARNGQNAAMIFKSPAEAELYGLKIRYLVTPIPDHPIPVMRSAEVSLSAAKYPLFPNENEWGRLGTTGSIGFIYLLVFSLGALISLKYAAGRGAALLGPCAALALACLLLSTVGGFGDFISTFVSPDIRCYGRIFPFIGFFSLAAAAVLISRLGQRMPVALRLPFWTALTVLAAYDQAVPSYANDHNQNIYRQDDDFVRYIETLLPPNSAIFELPFTDFPNEILPGHLLTNDLLRPYLHSAKYRWSWPAISGTTPAEWSRLAASLPTAEMLRAILQRGFSGLWVDTAGYDGGTSPVSAITTELGTIPRYSPDGRFLFYDLRPYAKAVASADEILGSAELLMRSPVQVIFERGFYYEEHGAGNVWRWSLPRSRITLINPLSIARKVDLSMEIQTAAPGQHSISTEWHGRRGRYRTPGPYTLAIELAPLETVSVDLRCDCPAVQPPGAARRLSFYASKVKLSEPAARQLTSAR